MDTESLNNSPSDEKISLNGRRKGFRVMLIPLLVAVYFMAGFTQLKPEDKNNISLHSGSYYSMKQEKDPPLKFTALLANEEFSKNLRDTVYTDRNIYLELRIDEQILYVHYRDGRVVKYPVSSGNKYLSKGIESRPGLFAIFLKEELHLSSQFNDAKMYYYMPFNMGIGFHSLAGTGYYGNLGNRPSSHGCIRMRTQDVKELFKQCEVGTLVLADRGKSARVIAFAPEGFKNDKEYSKEEYMEILAYNLNTLYRGRYFIDSPKRFIINPDVIPRIGFNVGTTDDIPVEQMIPVRVERNETACDLLNPWKFISNNVAEKMDDELSGSIQFGADSTNYSSLGLNVDKEMIDRLVYNRVGILPYFPPSRNIESPSAEDSETSTDGNSEPNTNGNVKKPVEGNSKSIPDRKPESPPDNNPGTEY